MFRRRETDIRPMLTFPATIRPRAHRRRTITTMTSLIAILGLVVAGGVSLAGLRGLVGRPDGHGAASGLDDAAVLAAGELGGVRWTLTGGFSDGVPCTQIQMGGQIAGGCWPHISASRPTAQLDAAAYALDWEGSPSSRRFSFATVIVPRDVAKVLVHSGTHVFRAGDPVEAPDGWGRVSVAIVPIEETTSRQLASPVRVEYLDAEGRRAYPDDELRLRNVPDVATGRTVPEYVTSEGALGRSLGKWTLFGWEEAGTGKFGIWLRGPEDVLATGSNRQWVEKHPLISIRPVCGQSTGILWGTVPGDVAAVEVGLVDPEVIDTVAGPRRLGDVRFALGTFEEFDPARAPVTYLDAAGKAIWTDWPSGPAPGSATPRCAGEGS
jgi:hypothetical protein